MAGHSHWAGIKHKKGRADKEKSKIFSKLSRELTVAHLGDGNIHYTIYPTKFDEILFDKLTNRLEEVTQELGGSFSAEHGIGLSKKKSMARRKDPVALEVMRSIKIALDPKNLMNPGKVLPDH